MNARQSPSSRLQAKSPRNSSSHKTKKKTDASRSLTKTLKSTELSSSWPPNKWNRVYSPKANRSKNQDSTLLRLVLGQRLAVAAAQKPAEPQSQQKPQQPRTHIKKPGRRERVVARYADHDGVEKRDGNQEEQQNAENRPAQKGIDGAIPVQI